MFLLFVHNEAEDVSYKTRTVIEKNIPGRVKYTSQFGTWR